MKSRVLKILMLAICTILVMSLLVGCAKGCAPNPEPPVKYEDREVGDFVVRFYEDYDYCEIKGTTAQGNEKKILIIPEYIEGVRVESLGVKGYVWDPSGLVLPEIVSDKLERVYFESTIKLQPWCFEYYNGRPNIEKVFYPGLEVLPYVMTRNGYDVYYPNGMYENRPAGVIGTKRANVSYYYNYENAKNSGYYWIDDYDYGEKIKLVPSDPTREGYTFAGWYKETGCVIEWDFDIDTLPELITEWAPSINGEYRDVPVYQETILYAKWSN